MKLRVKLDEKWPDGSKGGIVEVVEACCDSVRHEDATWHVTFSDGLFYAGLALGIDDLGWDIPFRFCPSCGAPVEIVGGGPA